MHATKKQIMATLIQAHESAIAYRDEFGTPFDPTVAGDWDSTAWEVSLGEIRRHLGDVQPEVVEELWPVFSAALELDGQIGTYQESQAN
jgi:hypothetical protein